VIRVGVIGALGRMGRMVCRSVAEDPDLALVAAVDRSGAGQSVDAPGARVSVSDDRQTLLQAEVEVAVEFTHPEAVMDNIRWAIGHAVHLVAGTTGIGPDELADIERLLEGDGRESNVVVAPNFAIGAVLAQRFAADASRFFPAAEIIELHHDGKADAPSGTALSTARRMARTRESEYRGPHSESLTGSRGGDLEGIRIHSVRLPGLVAHQEVILGGPGQVLTIRHDSMDRASFMPGVVLAVKEVVRRPGLTVGLEPLLGLGS
jgi:4-hydroxy-tetrahydrodipicolinate reductase